MRLMPWLAAVLLIAASCVQREAGPAQQSGGASEAAPKEVLVGAVYPFTGPQAPTGVDLRNGIDLAVELINAGNKDLDLPLVKDGGGLRNLGGAKLKIVYADSQADPAKGQSETERLLTSENVVAMLGAYNSAVTQTASQAAERIQKPFLNPESSSPSLVARGFKWFFRSTPDDQMFIENFFQFLTDVDKKFPGTVSKKVAVFNEDGLFGSDVNHFARELGPK